MEIEYNVLKTHRSTSNKTQSNKPNRRYPIATRKVIQRASDNRQSAGRTLPKLLDTEEQFCVDGSDRAQSGKVLARIIKGFLGRCSEGKRLHDTEPIAIRKHRLTRLWGFGAMGKDYEFRERGCKVDWKKIFLKPKKQNSNQKWLAFLQKAQRRSCQKDTATGGIGL